MKDGISGERGGGGGKKAYKGYGSYVGTGEGISEKEEGQIAAHMQKKDSPVKRKGFKGRPKGEEARAHWVRRRTAEKTISIGKDALKQKEEGRIAGRSKLPQGEAAACGMRERGTRNQRRLTGKRKVQNGEDSVPMGERTLEKSYQEVRR